MDWIPVSSQNIEAVGYEEPPVCRLYVRFNSGREYLYENVPPHVFQELMNAPSIGSYFHNNVRSAYGFIAI